MDGLLTRPVTADQSHYDAGHSERQQYDECGLHMIRVPYSLPSTRLMMMADMNMPAMIQNRSIISRPTRRAVRRSRSR